MLQAITLPAPQEALQTGMWFFPTGLLRPVTGLKESPQESRIDPVQRPEIEWFIMNPNCGKGKSSLVMGCTAHTTSAIDPTSFDVVQLIQAINFPWAASLDDKEHVEIIRDLGGRILTALFKTGDWSQYREGLAVWRLRADFARQYNAPPSVEEQAERDAWRMIQDDALAPIFIPGASS